MPNVKAIIARIKADAAAGKPRQMVSSHKLVAKPLSRSSKPKPPKVVTTGRRAAAKKAAAPAPAPTEEKTADEPTEGQS